MKKILSVDNKRTKTTGLLTVLLLSLVSMILTACPGGSGDSLIDSELIFKATSLSETNLNGVDTTIELPDNFHVETVYNATSDTHSLSSTAISYYPEVLSECLVLSRYFPATQ